MQQAFQVLTNHTHPIEFVLEHLEALRAQLTVHLRLAEILEADAEASPEPPAHH